MLPRRDSVRSALPFSFALVLILLPAMTQASEQVGTFSIVARDMQTGAFPYTLSRQQGGAC